MSKKVCICGADQGKEKPLVITITTCKNRHGREPTKCKSKEKVCPINIKTCPAAVCSSQSTIKSSRNSCKMRNSDSGTIDNLRYSSDEGCPGPGPKCPPVPKCPPPNPGCGEPVAISSCDLCSKKKKKKEKKCKPEKKSKKSCNQCCPPKPSCPPPPSCPPQPSCPPKPSCPPRPSCPPQPSCPPPPSCPPQPTCPPKPVCPKTKDQSLNCPSQPQVKLPILVPRYHGPGCAMEVDVLEKHDKHCRLKKLKNSKRGHDDRVGSYEVIGRVIFKTCQPPPCTPPPCATCPQSVKLATIYSLFNIPYGMRETCGVDLSSKSDKERMRFVQKYLKHQKVLENLAKSSKSFPTNLNKYDATSDFDDFRKEENVCRTYKNHKNYEVEELYISATKSNQSVQVTEKESEKSKHKLRRWMYFFFPCLYSYESSSSSSLGCSDLDMEYKNKRYEYMV